MPLLPRELFQRLDESPDENFYCEPRLVTHIDDATIAALTQVYRELVPAGAHVLDLMSSWVSHLPPEVDYGRVVGLGMNRVELAENPRLTSFLVHDLNRCRELPFADATFDAVLNAVSIQYLTRPVEVFASVGRVSASGRHSPRRHLASDFRPRRWQRGTRSRPATACRSSVPTSSWGA